MLHWSPSCEERSMKECWWAVKIVHWIHLWCAFIRENQRELCSSCGKMKITKYLPRNHVDALAMAFTFLMIPVSYLHGVLYIAPTIWPMDEPNLPEESANDNATSYYVAVFLMTFLFVNTYANLFLTLARDTSCAIIPSPVVAQPGWFYCPYCRFYVPPRAHHCPSCQTCILKRDHHCFFVGKCVGYHNHRYFVAFLIYLTLSAIVGVITSVIAILRLTGGLSLYFLPAFVFPVLAYLFQIMPVNFFVMFQTSVALLVTMAAGGLLILQFYLIYKGQTYHEMQKMIDIYGRSPRQNFQDALGKNWWFCWFLPFIPSPRLGDGAHYPPRDHVITGTEQAALSGPDMGGSSGGIGMERRDGRRKMVTSTWLSKDYNNCVLY